MPFVYYSQIHNLATLMPGRPSLRVARNGFVNNNEMAFLQKKIFLKSFFSKHLDTMSNVTDCDFEQGRIYSPGPSLT